MTSRVSARHSKRSITGWARWLLVLVFPFSAIFADTWLNTEKVKKDYMMATLSAQLKQERDQLDGLNAKIAGKGTAITFETEAPDLCLVPPEPNQIRMIYCTKSESEFLGRQPDYAKAEPRSDPNSGPDEAQTARAGGTGPTSDGDTTWNSDPRTNPERMTAMMDRLRQTIASACASYFGRS